MFQNRITSVGRLTARHNKQVDRVVNFFCGTAHGDRTTRRLGKRPGEEIVEPCGVCRIVIAKILDGELLLGGQGDVEQIVERLIVS